MESTPINTGVSRPGKRDRAVTGADAGRGAGLALVTGLRIGYWSTTGGLES